MSENYSSDSLGTRQQCQSTMSNLRGRVAAIPRLLTEHEGSRQHKRTGPGQDCMRCANMSCECKCECCICCKWPSQRWKRRRSTGPYQAELMHESSKLSGMLSAYPSLHSRMLKQEAAPFQTAFKLQTAGLTEVGACRNASNEPRHPAISPGCSIPAGPMHEQGPRQLTARNLQEEPFLPPAIRSRYCKEERGHDTVEANWCQVVVPVEKATGPQVPCKASADRRL